jgi:hypothetical protein
MTLRTRRDREKLRRVFRPAHVQLLFIGEAPPASGRFFYCGNSGLYRAMRDAFRSIDPSIDDENFLAVFKALGCYLTDLCAEPVDTLDSQSRRAARHAGERSLARSIAQLEPAIIAPVLRSIAGNVVQACSWADWHGPIIHLPYPGRWQRLRNAFIDTLAPTICGLMGSSGRAASTTWVSAAAPNRPST